MERIVRNVAFVLLLFSLLATSIILVWGFGCMFSHEIPAGPVLTVPLPVLVLSLSLSLLAGVGVALYLQQTDDLL